MEMIERQVSTQYNEKNINNYTSIAVKKETKLFVIHGMSLD